MFLLNLKYSIKIANKLRDLQYKMFLLNQDIIEIADMAEQNLQYKMFLLNRFGCWSSILSRKFTIQNVPIKCRIRTLKKFLDKYLQYKMFLLNKEQSKNTGQFFNIYNTKCSY